MNFDEIIERRDTHSLKWDMMEPLFGVPKSSGISMWVADMDFRPPEAATDALEAMLRNGIFGYYGDERGYREAIVWWMANRHDWLIEPDWVFSTHGLVNGMALAVDTFTKPGDGIVLFTPVYHAFAKIIEAAHRRVIECPLSLKNGRYEFDFSVYGQWVQENAKMAILCSPHNPGGRVWTRDELRDVHNFCQRHDLILVSDEIHHDLVMPGHQHVVMPLAAPEAMDRLVMLTATTKTFNLAGAHIGNVIIADERLRSTFAQRMNALGISPNSFGMFLAESVYSLEGAEWVDALMQYLDHNRRLFDARMNQISGVHSMSLEATYLAWVGFHDMKLSDEEIRQKINGQAQVAVNYGSTFGMGGQGFHRFNIATPRSVLEDALGRLEQAFDVC